MKVTKRYIRKMEDLYTLRSTNSINKDLSVMLTHAITWKMVTWQTTWTYWRSSDITFTTGWKTAIKTQKILLIHRRRFNKWIIWTKAWVRPLSKIIMGILTKISIKWIWALLEQGKMLKTDRLIQILNRPLCTAIPQIKIAESYRQKTLNYLIQLLKERK